jgi:hypothetical protein
VWILLEAVVRGLCDVLLLLRDRLLLGFDVQRVGERHRVLVRVLLVYLLLVVVQLRWVCFIRRILSAWFLHLVKIGSIYHVVLR